MNRTKKILILSANPKDTARLRLDEEVREIEEGLRRSKYRDQFIIHSKWAIRLKDLRRALLDEEPQIVHFCGHGEQEGLIVEDDIGNKILLDPKVIAGLFELFKQHVECVLLNACYSQTQAEAINEYINYVIGMKKGIQDKTAIEFAVGFYDALGAGKEVEEAFKFGCNAIQLYNLPEHLTPLLKKKSNSQVQLILVKRIYKQERDKILQVLYEASARSPQNVLDSDELASQVGSSWERIQNEIAYLEKKGYLILTEQQLGIRIFRMLYLTAEGVDVVEKNME